jgi:hypothetical protein
VKLKERSGNRPTEPVAELPDRLDRRSAYRLQLRRNDSIISKLGRRVQTSESDTTVSRASIDRANARTFPFGHCVDLCSIGPISIEIFTCLAWPLFCSAASSTS